MINWTRLARAIDFYQGEGYRLIEVPWIVSKASLRVTAPSEDAIMGVSDDMGLVGSAEQGFIELWRHRVLPPGRYVTCSPCFRNETVVDDLHRQYFMKVELFRNDIVNFETLSNMVESAKSCFRSMLDIDRHLEVVGIAGGIDINLADIEIGSYGVRSLATSRFIYGTGLAEPRFGIARERSMALFNGTVEL